MFKNYFKTGLRNLSRHKTNSIINIAGLMVGFAAFLLIFLVIQYERSFDDFHANKKDIYRVNRIGKNLVNQEYRAGVPFPVTQGLRNDFPQLSNAAAIFEEYGVQVNVTSPDGSLLKKFKEDGVFITEPQFFHLFDFPLAEGNADKAISEPYTVLLTKSIAAKYFGDWKTAIGKTLGIFGFNMKVTGILNDPPPNTDFPLRVVVSYATLVKNVNMNNWSSISDLNYCFVQLNKGSSPKQFNELLKGFVDKHIKAVNPNYDLLLQPLSEIHYDERFGNFNGRTFSKDLILALSLIGLFLLIIACVNFINLTTAQAVNRAREVGVRKVLGGNRAQLVFQFLGETGLTSLLALIGSIIIAIVFIPFLNSLLDIHLSTDILYTGRSILFIICALVLVTFLSGFYPALVLSGFKSATVLKSAISMDHKKGIFFRRGLVVFQFVIAQALIIGTLVVASQMDYFRNADLGFRKNAIINARFPNDSLSRTKVDLLRNELLKMQGVENVSFSSFAPSEGGGWYTDLRVNGNHSNEPDMIVCMKPADTSYFHLYDLQLVAGRIYFESDTTREYVVNEAVVRKLGIQDPKKAIGKLIEVNGPTAFPIVGVVKDYHINSLRDPIGAVVMTSSKHQYGLANIKIDMRDAKKIIASMEKIWNRNFPDFVFEYNFLDQSIALFYEQENQLAQLYKIFSGIAIFISCLGLYGLISFMAIQRRKEIGIRKVLGAPVQDIVIMLSREFTILIALAFVIASPIAWYFMNKWLLQYTYRVTLGVWFFAVTILGSLFIAWLTVGYTAIKAAMENPVKSLRTE
ncbi:MAG TPA: ABC transporter permease [Puia sp.]|nr:ABC transporter permease [Puia sp.]